MEVFIVIHQDRHCDTQAHPFSTPEKAIQRAQEIARDYDLEGLDQCELTQGMKRDGWIFYRNLTVESDSVRVVRRDLDA